MFPLVFKDVCLWLLPCGFHTFCVAGDGGGSGAEGFINGGGGDGDGGGGWTPQLPAMRGPQSWQSVHGEQIEYSWPSPPSSQSPSEE